MISHRVEISIAGGVADEIDEGNRGFFSFFFFLFSFFIYHVFVDKVQEIAWSASYGENKTIKESNDPHHPLMGKIKPLKTRAHPPPSQHLRRKQDEAIPSSRHVRKDKYRNETNESHKPFGGSPSPKEKNLTAQGQWSGRIKLMWPEYLREFPKPNGLRARWDRDRVLGRSFGVRYSDS